MRKTKHTFRLPQELSVKLMEYAARRRVTQTVVVEAAINAFFSPDSSERMEAALTRRLDGMSRKMERMERMERDIEISNEAIGLFVQFWLTTTPPLPPSELNAARASGRKRYADFIEALGDRMGSNSSIAGDIDTVMGNESEP